MAGMQIPDGVGGANGFERFRALREQAQQRLRRTDVESRLQTAIQKQQASGSAAGSPAQSAAPGPAGQYASAGALEKPDPKPALGQILDLLA